jgi:hypothetical protein
LRRLRSVPDRTSTLLLQLAGIRMSRKQVQMIY